MSLAFIHIGQCGNQLGQQFWEEMEILSAQAVQTEAPSTKISPSKQSHKVTSNKPHISYSLPDGSLPCVLVDSERKVVQRSARTLRCKVSSDLVFSDKTGRGNNWAYGYNGRSLRKPGDVYGPKNLTECVLEGVRRTAERCDRFIGTVLFHSLAGGTGSGLGSSLVECLRDEYPLAYLLSVLVAPFEHGETPLQHYNSLFCLSWVQRYCDAALLFRNDLVLEQTLKQGQAMARQQKLNHNISMFEMNENISKCLCNTFLPFQNPKSSQSCFEPLDMIRSLCSDPSTKFISPVHTYSTQSTTTWDQLITSLTRPNPPSHTHTLSAIFIARGNNRNMEVLEKKSKSIENKMKRIYNTVDWNPFPVDFWFSKELHFQDRKNVSILTNSSAVCDYIKDIHRKAKAMFEEKAYVHWYQKYCCNETMFCEAFEGVQTIVDNYSL